MKNFCVCGTTKFFICSIAVLLLVGCAASPLDSTDSSQRASLSLPTAGPTVAPSPVSTRVMPADSLTPPPTKTITPIPDETLGLVVEVLDGETIAVVLDGDPARLAYEVKYLGIAAPPNSPDEPWGVVAFETNRRLANLKVVRLLRDQTDFDDDGYMLRYVYLGDQLLNAQLVEEGLARAAVTAPDDRFEDDLLAAEADARAKQIRLWPGEDPTATPDNQPPAAATSPIQTPVLSVTVTFTATTTITPVTVTPTLTATATATAESTATPARTRTSTPTATPTGEEDSSGLQGPN